MEPKRQKDAMRHLIQEGMRVEIAEKMDLETLLFVDNSKNPDNEIDEKNYKWVTSGDGYNEFPFKKWQLKNFFYEIAHETETLFLGFQQDMGIEKLILSVCKMLRCINLIKPDNSDDLIRNAIYIRVIEEIQCVETPYINREHDLWYTVDLPIDQRNMLMSVSRYIEGLIYSKVSEMTFKRIKNNPFRSENNIYKGFEMLYTILNAERTFKTVRNANTLGLGGFFKPTVEEIKKTKEWMKEAHERYAKAEFEKRGLEYK